MQEDKTRFHLLEAEILAISVDTPLVTKEKLLTKLDLNFLILSDSTLETIKRYGVLDSKSQIALPSTFVVDKKGIIRWVKIGESKFDRPKNEDILEVLQKINDEN